MQWGNWILFLNALMFRETKFAVESSNFMISQKAFQHVYKLLVQVRLLGRDQTQWLLLVFFD